MVPQGSMKTNNLPISQCHSTCPKCNIETDFQFFESGSGGDFETYTGVVTGNIYRLDMHKVHYLNSSEEELLAPAIELEGSRDNLRNIPDQVTCKVCKSIFKAMPITFGGEVKVKAIEL